MTGSTFSMTLRPIESAVVAVAMATSVAGFTAGTGDVSRVASALLSVGAALANDILSG